MNENPLEGETPIIFVAMVWGGGGPYTMSQILHVYDWVNRAIPEREDLETALNALLHLGLVEEEDGAFRVVRKEGEAFEAYRKKNRKSKFATVRKYFERFEPPADLPRRVEISKARYAAALKAYRKSFGADA